MGMMQAQGVINQMAMQSLSQRGKPSVSLASLHRDNRGRPQRPAKGKGTCGPLPTLTGEDLANPQALLEAVDKRDEARCRAFIAHSDFQHINEKTPEGRTAPHVAMLRK